MGIRVQGPVLAAGHGDGTELVASWTTLRLMPRICQTAQRPRRIERRITTTKPIVMRRGVADVFMM